MNFFLLDPLVQPHVEIFRDEPVHLLPFTLAEKPKEQPLIQQTNSLDGSAIKKKGKDLKNPRTKITGKSPSPLKITLNVHLT